ncbi:MAG: type I-C CRISPR-associated protein Cas8c/Csd1 [Kiritimatiellae bacterium]|nr:type I-C CRISPR-associated protein Cas8c/Csd1 [Kiritimatiellia bacterium]
MGLWQNLVAGYDENSMQLSNVAAGGIYPLSSTTVSNQTEMLAVIVLDENGHFIRSEMISKRNDKKGIFLVSIPIPVTQESLSRARQSNAHPVFDQREYVFPGVENNRQKPTEKNTKYKALLREFAESPFSTSAVKAVWNYISDENREFSSDLPEGTKAKTIVLFKVEIPGCPETALWKSPELFKLWHSFYLGKVADESSNAIDFVTGKTMPVAQFHPKKVLSFAGNAKLISANDEKNFTFRGIYRHPKNLPKSAQTAFEKQFGLSDAVTIGYETSQKAHQYLRYLMANHGISCGDQVIVPFSIGTSGKMIPSPPVQDSDDDWNEDETETTADTIMKLGSRSGKNYAKSIRNALHGYELDRQWKAHARSAIVILEAATPGRLSVTFYREFASSEYMECIAQWHEECMWPLWHKKDKQALMYFGAPSIDRIIQAAFGWPKPGQDKAYEKIRMRARQNLIRSIFDNAPIPADYLANAISRVSNPLGITGKNGTFDRKRFSSVLATTCAIFKHETYNQEESFDMSIEPKRTDRDYLYGRLLGAADKLEQYALRKKNNDRPVTAAIRYMQTFSQRPFSAWQIIHQSLVPYKQQVRGSIADMELQAIFNQFNGDGKDFGNDSPLSGHYLIGYYHECAYIDELIRAAHEKTSVNNQQQEN